MYNKFWDYTDNELISMTLQVQHMEAEEIRELCKELANRLEDVIESMSEDTFE